MKIIVDSSLIIDKLRGGSKWDYFLNSLDEDTELFLPTVVVLEIFSGESTKKPLVAKKIHNFFKYFTKVELNYNIAVRAGELYRSINFKLDIPDYIIASSALELGGEVATLNKKHFLKVPGLRLYNF